MYEEESVLLPKIESLCEDKLYESADIIAQCLLSNPNPSLNFLKLYAKILFKRGEYKRAINYYAQALGLMNLSKSKATKDEISIKSLIFTCYFKLKLYEQAVATIKQVSLQQLKTNIILLLARAHRILQFTADAIACYTEILKRNPLALEAVIALTQFKQPPNEIMNLSIKKLNEVFPSKKIEIEEEKQTANGKGKTIKLKPTTNSRKSQKEIEEREKENQNFALLSSLRSKFKPFYESFVLAHTFNSNSQYKQKITNKKESLQYFTQIQSEYKKHLHSLQYLGLCHTRLGSLDQAKYSFEIIRSTDKCYIESMDTYANLIKKSGNLAELNKLARDILSVDCYRPESWIAMALYCDLKGQKEDAKIFVDKAVYLSTGKLTSALALVLRGELQLSLDSPVQAIESFKKAYEIEKDYSVFKGIVHAHLGVLRFDEALSYAKEACLKHPNNPHTLSLLAYALMQSPIVDGKVQAKKFLENALKIDPANFDAIMTLVQLFALEQKFPDAIDLLKKHLQRENAQADLVYTKLGDIYVKTKNYAEAMIQYHSALNINPNLEKAKLGLKSLEKLLNRLGTSDDSIDLATDEEDSLEINEEAEIEESGSVQEEEEDSFESFM